jgi:hypothetical protein
MVKGFIAVFIAVKSLFLLLMGITPMVQAFDQMYLVKQFILTHINSYNYMCHLCKV